MALRLYTKPQLATSANVSGDSWLVYVKRRCLPVMTKHPCSVKRNLAPRTIKRAAFQNTGSRRTWRAASKALRCLSVAHTSGTVQTTARFISLETCDPWAKAKIALRSKLLVPSITHLMTQAKWDLMFPPVKHRCLECLASPSRAPRDCAHGWSHGKGRAASRNGILRRSVPTSTKHLYIGFVLAFEVQCKCFTAVRRKVGCS